MMLRAEESMTKREGIERRAFVKAIGLGAAAASAGAIPSAAGAEQLSEQQARAMRDDSWPVLKLYDRDHLTRIALPLGGIGTGTVSLGGRGDLRDWEIMNRPAKGYVPVVGEAAPFFALYARRAGAPAVCRVLEGPVDVSLYEGSHGSTVPNDNLPRFRNASFASAYPLGRVMLSDPDVPVTVDLKAFNPFIPPDADLSGIPVAVLIWEVRNDGTDPVEIALCGSLPNFIGIDGFDTRKDWKGDSVPFGASKNRNQFRTDSHVRGIFMDSACVPRDSAAWGTIALGTTAAEGVTHRTSWTRDEWGGSVLDFWDDFSDDGRLDDRPAWGTDTPVGSVAVACSVPPRQTRSVTFLLAWHFPNRQTWTPDNDAPRSASIVGNYYAGQYRDAFDVLEKTAARLPDLQRRTVEFVRCFCSSPLPAEVKEAALFNLSTLRTQTCFRTPDGSFFGWEGTGNSAGCCHGSCTHVWNYEQATPFLFGVLARSMREVEFRYATSADGAMSFRVSLPLAKGTSFGKAAADGQMGCIMKMYRDWQLSGDDEFLHALWPGVRKAVEFCWIRGGWDADRDGVMEGCQHNTMDVEYYGPNPQMEAWYLGALRAAEEMARRIGDSEFAARCRSLFERGRAWTEVNLFNGEYYEHHVRPPRDASEVAPSLRVGMGARDITKPDYQLASGCLVDQLVGQYMAHVCGLGYLLEKTQVRKTLESILKYNDRRDLQGHFNSLRTFALADEPALLMASYPKGRPKNPFPYFGEVMTGFEYTAAVGMLYEGMTEDGLRCIRHIRERYDGRKRSPFDEAECGHHYARAMASWAAVLALSGFAYSGVTREMTFAPAAGRWFWSNGASWGICEIAVGPDAAQVSLDVREGELKVRRLALRDYGAAAVTDADPLRPGTALRCVISPRKSA
jgi:non-lysosomal glucosylceramidase